MNTALQMPGWGNSFTPPIANRIEMLSTGVRLPVALKVFGANLDEIQRVGQEIATTLRGVRGAADVFPDQVTGKGTSRSTSTGPGPRDTASASATSRTSSR